jgi:hypothetical protein
MHTETVHVGTGTVEILPHVLDAPLSASFLFLGRHEYHQTGGRLADLLSGPAEHNIQQASFTMTTQDQQIGLHVCRDLHNDVPGISRAQDGLTGANAGKFTVATLAKNYTFWSGYFSLRQARKIKRL